MGWVAQAWCYSHTLSYPECSPAPYPVPRPYPGPCPQDWWPHTPGFYPHSQLSSQDIRASSRVSPASSLLRQA